jgi:hypothetical protein
MASRNEAWGVRRGRRPNGHVSYRQPCRVPSDARLGDRHGRNWLRYPPLDRAKSCVVRLNSAWKQRSVASAEGRSKGVRDA